MLQTYLTEKFYSLLRHNGGAVAIMFVGFLNVMLGMLALSLDVGRGYLASSEIQNAATAASISSAIENGDVDAARRYFVSNLPAGLHSIDYDFDNDVQVVVNGSSVSVIPTGFDVPSFFPMGDLSAGAGGVGGFLQVGSISTVGLPSGAIQPADYFFVLDVSGSMTVFDSICPNSGGICSRIASVKEAVTNVVTTISNAQNSAANYAVSLVSWATSTYSTYSLSNNFQAALSWINQNLSGAGGATCGGCGLNSANNDLPASTGGRTKVVVFMTDGSMNQCTPTNCGCPVCPQPFTQACLNQFRACTETNGFQFARDACDLVKQDPEVTFWAITFGGDVNNDQRNAQLRDYCASVPEQSIHVANGQELDQLFNEIFNATGRIRVTR